MTRKNIFVFSALALLGWMGTLSSCRKDMGNYTYETIDTLSIGGIADDYQIGRGSPASIYPELTFVLGSAFDESEYAYEWKSYKSGASSADGQVIHDGKNLDFILPLGVGDYTFYYTVTQKSTGITWQKQFNLDIYGEFQKAGWFVLNDIQGKTRLDYYEDDPDNWNSFPVVYRDIANLIQDVNTGETLTLSGRPLSLAAFTNRDALNTTFTYRLYINTENTTEILNLTDGFIYNKLQYAFVNETISGEPSSVEKIYPGTTGGAYAYKDNNIYIFHYTYSLYGTPINRITGSGTFPVSEHFAAPYNTYMHAMFFDMVNRRFLRSTLTSNAATIINTQGQAFDLADVGKDLVWMGYTRIFNGQVVGILKDHDSRYFLARIGFPYSVSSPTISALSITDITDVLTDIGQADRFVLDQQYGYLFYAVGSKLYQYDMDSQLIKLAKDYGNRKISLLKVNDLNRYTMSSIPAYFVRLGSPGYAIIVGSYDESDPDNSGTVDFFNAQSLMGDLVAFHEPFQGLGIVVDVKYSEL